MYALNLRMVSSIFNLFLFAFVSSKKGDITIGKEKIMQI